MRDFPSRRNTWRRLFVLITNLPRESATMLALSDGAAGWGPTEYLLAAAVDALNAANWQRGSGKGARPKAVPRPGMKTDDPDRIGGGTTYTVDEVDALLASNRDPDEGGA